MLLASSLLMTTLLSADLADASVLAVPKGGVTVDVDLTFLWPIGIFLVLILVLKPVLFDPMLRLFEERERRIEGAKLSARKLDLASAEALTTYETAMKKARSAGNADREAQRADGLRTESEIVGKVREVTTESVNAGRKTLQVEAETARAALKADAGALAGAMASRVLGREVRG